MVTGQAVFYFILLFVLLRTQCLQEQPEMIRAL